MKKLKIGDVVKLKSGSPDMTVGQINIVGAPDYVSCSWFDEGKIQKAKFHKDSLTLLKVNPTSED